VPADEEEVDEIPDEVTPHKEDEEDSPD